MQSSGQHWVASYPTATNHIVKAAVFFAWVIATLGTFGPVYAEGPLKVYKNTEYSFEFKYPASWVPLSRRTQGTQVVLSSTDDTRASCGIVVNASQSLSARTRSSLDNQIGRESYTEEYWMSGYANYKNVKIIEFGKIEFPFGLTGYSIASFDNEISGKINSITSILFITYIDGASLNIVCQTLSKYFPFVKESFYTVPETLVIK